VGGIMTDKFTAAAGETAAMTAAYFAKHKCSECVAYWRDGIDEYCLARPRKNGTVAVRLLPGSTACNKFRNKEQSK
jgi:hypothetical protein